MHQGQGLKEYIDVWRTKIMVQKGKAEKERRGTSQRTSRMFPLNLPYMVGQDSAQSCWSSKGGGCKWTETGESPATHLSCTAALVPNIWTQTGNSWITWPWLTSGPGGVVHLPEDFFFLKHWRRTVLSSGFLASLPLSTRCAPCVVSS